MGCGETLGRPTPARTFAHFMYTIILLHDQMPLLLLVYVVKSSRTCYRGQDVAQVRLLEFRLRCLIRVPIPYPHCTCDLTNPHRQLNVTFPKPHRTTPH
jgi:hypothetical protein